MIIPVVILAIGQIATGEVSTRVCLADGNTPLELADANTPFVYRDIMVDTKLTIIISSDTNDYWDGGLFITGTDRDYGFLSGRDFNETSLDWQGSHFEAAGDRAFVFNEDDYIKSGFQLIGHKSAVAGDWFIIDYTATSVGNCIMDLFDYSISWFEPVYNLTFSHVPTRDFNSDTIIDFADFTVFASYWRQNNCIDPGWCMGADLNTDGDVNVYDLLLFAEFWLESTE